MKAQPLLAIAAAGSIAGAWIALSDSDTVQPPTTPQWYVAPTTSVWVAWPVHDGEEYELQYSTNMTDWMTYRVITQAMHKEIVAATNAACVFRLIVRTK